MKHPFGLIPSLLASGLVAVALSGCAQNPATGGTTFTGGLSQAQEIQIGQKNHAKIIKEFGGEYGTPALKRYVNGIGQLLAKISERPDLKFTFTLLNSNVVNAFATPGGYVYITRGLMALADNEAQIASVLAHEIGHITALHHAQRHGQSLLANIGLAAAGILGGRHAAEIGQLGAVTLLQGFSRDNEYEADGLGMRYLSRVGFDPVSMADFLAKLRANSRLNAVLRGESADKVDQFNYLATHPAPVARVKRALALARQKNVKNPVTARGVYLSKLDGLLYGTDSKEGFIRGRDFLHPKLRFAYSVPEGFRLRNSKKAVYAFGPNKSRIIFDRASKPAGGSMEYYLSRVWGAKMRLRDLETLRVNGLEAATATTQMRTNSGIFDARLTAFKFNTQTIYRMIFLTAGADTNRLADGLRRTTYSFRRIDAAEAIGLRPLILRIITVQRGDTVESLAHRMPYGDYKLKRFEILNGISRKDQLRPGQKLKIVSTN